MLAIFIKIVHLYAWASGAMAKFAGMPRKLKFYQKAKMGERIKAEKITRKITTM